MVKSHKLHLNLWCIVYFLKLNIPDLCLKLGLVNPEKFEPGNLFRDYRFIHCPLMADFFISSLFSETHGCVLLIFSEEIGL